MILTILFLEVSAGAVPAEEWNNTFKGENNSYANYVQQTLDGGYIIAGEKNEYGIFIGDAWLIKTDANGTEQWNKTFGGSSHDVALYVRQTPDGYALIGQTLRIGKDWEDNYGLWLIKTDSNGNIKWNKTFGGKDRSFANIVQQTSDGGYILGGHIYPYDNGSFVSDSYFWIIKIDADGNEQWDKMLGKGDAISINQTSDGGFLVAGQARIVKTNANGDQEVNKTFMETRSEVRSVQQTSDGGNILIGQTFTGSTSKGECKNGLCSDMWISYHDVWLKKTDAYGELVWKKILFLNSTSSYPNSVQQTPDGGYLLQGTEGTKVWLIKTDSYGNQKWNKINSKESDNIVSTQQTMERGYILASSIRKSSVNSEIWILKMAGESIEQAKTLSSSPIEIPKAGSTHTPRISNETELINPKEKASGFEIFLAITILSLAIMIKRR